MLNQYALQMIPRVEKQTGRRWLTPVFIKCWSTEATEDLPVGGKQAILLPGPASRTYELCSHEGPHAQEGSVLRRKGRAHGLMLCPSQELRSPSSSLPTSSESPSYAESVF